MDARKRDHAIGTIVEDGHVKLDFGGPISFLKMEPSEAIKLARALTHLADVAADPVMKVARDANAALKEPDTVGLAFGIDPTKNRLVIRFTEYVNRLEFAADQGAAFVAGFQHFLARLK